MKKKTKKYISGDVNWRSTDDANFLKDPSQQILVKTETSVYVTIAKSIFVNIYFKFSFKGEKILAWAILNEPKLDKLDK